MEGGQVGILSPGIDDIGEDHGARLLQGHLPQCSRTLSVAPVVSNCLALGADCKRGVGRTLGSPGQSQDS